MTDHAEKLIPEYFTEHERYRELIRWVAEKHAGQTDKQGRPYTDHLFAVANAMHDVTLRLPAYAHDVIEDTDATVDTLLKRGFLWDEAQIVSALTHFKGDSLHHYVKRLAFLGGRPAIDIKIMDVLHNMSRLEGLDNPTRARLSLKYQETLMEIARAQFYGG